MSRLPSFGGWKHTPALLLALVIAAAIPAVRAQAADESAIFPFLPQVTAGPMPGLTNACDDFKLAILPFGLLEFDIADEGWVWVDPARKFRSVSGRVKGSHVAYNDTPANHDSHDHNTNIVVDAGFEDILSIANDNDDDDPRPVDTIEVEWEIGAKPGEKTGDGANPTFPKWAWPSVGDRVWVEGHWIFDCGHPTEEIVGYTNIPGFPPIPIIVKHYRSEIHPARAIAAMRDQARALPGSGNMAVPVTATDLYIHGRGGFVVEQLNCGMGIIIDGVPPNGDHDGCATKTTPIARNYEFDVCLPPAHPGGTLTWTVEPGPGNTIAVDPVITERTPAGPACQGAFDTQKMLHVLVPLSGSGAVPEDVYARKIYAGWVGGTQPELRHFKVTLKRMDLHDDQDVDPGNGELSFFWMNVNRADTEWIRLSDFNGDMAHYDDDKRFGDGFLSFPGAVFDFFVRPNQTFTISANGYDQDCYDGSFGNHDLRLSTYVGCALDIPEPGNNDPMVRLPSDVDPQATTFGEPGYGVGNQDLKARRLVVIGQQVVPISQYELEIRIEEILDNTPPVTTAIATPPANGAGWNNTNVTVSFSAVDNPGGTGVADIVLHGEGTEPFDVVVPAGTTSRTFTAEGITAITYFARDVQGNQEVPRTITVRIDKTAPTISGSRTPAANQYGWNNTDVTVEFSCADALSGIGSCGPTQVVSTEGANQSRTGVAVDQAGNTATAEVTGISVDKTPPVITGLPADCVLSPANHRMVAVGTASVTDALSGVLPGTFVVTATSNEPANGTGDGSTSPDIVIIGGQIQLRAERAGTGTGRAYSIGATASDLAGNVATGGAVCRVPHGGK